MPVRAALLAVLVAAAPAATPAAAQARFVLGIADQSTAMLADERFTALGVTDTRIVVPYDVALDPAQLARYAPFLDTADALGLRVLVAFNGPAGSKRLPTVRAYTKAMRAFRARFPAVRDLGTWNEANHASQPTARHPGRAAQYFNALRGLCRDCRIVAADVLDQAGFATWIRTFRRTARGARIWGLHNYVDVNRNRDVSIPRLRRATGGRGSVWLTETGGVVRFARSFGYDERRAARSTRHVLTIATRRKVARVYLYQWTGAPLGSRWDSGLVAADGRARPALNVIERYLRKPLTPLPPIPRVPRFPRAPAPAPVPAPAPPAAPVPGTGGTGGVEAPAPAAKR